MWPLAVFSIAVSDSDSNMDDGRRSPGDILEGTSKTVFHLLYDIFVSVYDVVDNSELILIIYCNPPTNQ